MQWSTIGRAVACLGAVLTGCDSSSGDTTPQPGDGGTPMGPAGDSGAGNGEDGSVQDDPGVDPMDDDAGAQDGDGAVGSGPGSSDGPVSELCVDNDGDGFGMQCIAGDDCDDEDPTVGGQDVCNGQDDDCDGKVDEFLVDVCDNCDIGCFSAPTPAPTQGWEEPTEANSQDVLVDEGGAITLSREEMESFAVWIANDTDRYGSEGYEGTVSKLDSRTNVELARYPAVRYADVGGPEGLGGTSALRARSSRTALDQNFDAYVGNRHHGNFNVFSTIGTVSKFANEERDCIDRNLNGVIDTSRDINGDGDISMDPADGEFLGQADECVLWTTAVGEAGGWPRALAVGLGGPDRLVGDVYVGMYTSGDVCRLRASDGRVEVCVHMGDNPDQAPFKPYGAASDGLGRVWFVSREPGTTLGYVDAVDQWTTLPEAPTCGNGRDWSNAPCTDCPPQPYGVAIDGENRAHFATSNCHDGGVYRYDPATDSYDQLTVPDGGTARGVAVNEDSIWVAISGGDRTQGANGNNNWSGGERRLEQFNKVTLEHTATFNMPSGRNPVGVGVSFDGSIWGINQGTGHASRLDPSIADGQPGQWTERQLLGLIDPTNPAAGTTPTSPYTYSDFIGFGLNVFVDPRGFYRFTVQGCGPGQRTRWRGVRHISELPEGTEVFFNVRSADTREGLQQAAWVGAFSGNPADLDEAPGPVDAGGYLEVEVVLTTQSQDTAPRVFGVEVVQECGVLIE